MRLDDAVCAFVVGWSIEGPRVPSPSTVRTYKWALDWLVEFAHSRNKMFLSDLTPELLRAAIRVRTEARGADKEKDHSSNWKGGEGGAYIVAAAAKRLAGWLLVQGLSVHDLSKVRAPRAPERIQPRVSSAEFSRMEAAILRRLLTGDPEARATVARDLALVNLLADTGLRCAELVSMRLDSLNLEQGWVQIVGKGSKERALSIWDAEDRHGGQTIAHLRAWLDERDKLPGVLDTRALWLNNKWRPVTENTLRALLSRICQDAGVTGNRPPHTFRRSHFSEAYKENPETVKLLAARMGWSPKSHAMVDVYTRGANIELTRLQPVPLVSKRLRNGGESDPAQATQGRAALDRATRRHPV